ncbi:MAG: pyridoxamine 5'-phosphate oxidase family protein [Candidatus Methanomethylophilaceae archaeon]
MPLRSEGDRVLQPKMQKNAMGSEEILSFLENNQCGVLSTTGEDGYPYGTPMDFVLLDDRVYFHGRGVGEKISNLKRDPRCCLTVHRCHGHEVFQDGKRITTVYDSVVLRGEASVLEDREYKERALLALCRKVVPSYASVDDKAMEMTAVIEMRVVHASGKRHRPGPESRVIPCVCRESE